MTIETEFVGAIEIEPGLESDPSLTFVGDPGTGFYNPAAGVCALSSNGVDSAHFSTSIGFGSIWQYNNLAGGLSLRDTSGVEILATATGGNWGMFNLASFKFSQNSVGGGAKALEIVAGMHVAIATGTELVDIDFALNRTVSWLDGPVPIQRAFLVRAPTYDFIIPSSISEAATLSIEGSPIAGPNANIIDSYSLLVQSGNSRFKGKVIADEVVAGDLHLKSESDVHWILREESDRIVAINMITGKRYQISMTPIEDKA